MAGVAAGLAVVSAPLWGRQAGASILAIPTVPWMLPAALLVIVGRGLFYELPEMVWKRALGGRGGASSSTRTVSTTAGLPTGTKR